MRIWKNLFGKDDRIHGDVIYFESGSNANGRWIRIGDWQVCTANVVVDFSNNDVQTFPYPVEFIDVFHVSMGYITASSSQVVLPIIDSTLIRQQENGWDVYKYGDTYNDTRRLSLFAIGRWK